MSDPAQSGTTEKGGADDDSVARKAQAASDAGDNHDVGTDGDEESAADRQNGQ